MPSPQSTAALVPDLEEVVADAARNLRYNPPLITDLPAFPVLRGFAGRHDWERSKPSYMERYQRLAGSVMDGAEAIIAKSQASFTSCRAAIRDQALHEPEEANANAAALACEVNVLKSKMEPIARNSHLALIASQRRFEAIDARSKRGTPPKVPKERAIGEPEFVLGTPECSRRAPSLQPPTLVGGVAPEACQRQPTHAIPLAKSATRGVWPGQVNLPWAPAGPTPKLKRRTALKISRIPTTATHHGRVGNFRGTPLPVIADEPSAAPIVTPAPEPLTVESATPPTPVSAQPTPTVSEASGPSSVRQSTDVDYEVSASGYPLTPVGASPGQASSNGTPDTWSETEESAPEQNQESDGEDSDSSESSGLCEICPPYPAWLVTHNVQSADPAGQTQSQRVQNPTQEVQNSVAVVSPLQPTVEHSADTPSDAHRVVIFAVLSLFKGTGFSWLILKESRNYLIVKDFWLKASSQAFEFPVVFSTPLSTQLILPLTERL